MLDRLRRLMPNQAALQNNRWLRWLGPGLFHPRLWHMSRRGIALGAAIGAFFAFVTPVAQIPLSAAVAVVLKANIPASVVGTLINTPPTFAPVYYGAWRVGSWILGEEADESKAAALPGASAPAAEGSQPDARSTWQRMLDGLDSVGKPLAVGAFVFGCVAAVLVYLLVNGIWHLRVRMKRRARLRARVAARTG